MSMLAMLYPRDGFGKGRFGKYSRAYVQIFRPGRLIPSRGDLCPTPQFEGSRAPDPRMSLIRKE